MTGAFSIFFQQQSQRILTYERMTFKTQAKTKLYDRIPDTK